MDISEDVSMQTGREQAASLPAREGPWSLLKGCLSLSSYKEIQRKIGRIHFFTYLSHLRLWDKVQLKDGIGGC